MLTSSIPMLEKLTTIWQGPVSVAGLERIGLDPGPVLRP